MGRLLVIEGEGNGTSYELADSTGIGRLKSNEIMVKDSKTSRQNSRISRQTGSWFIEDLKSSNGTFVNGAKIDRRTRIRHGDRIKIGLVTFLFEEDREAAAPVGRTPGAAAQVPKPAPRPAAPPANAIPAFAPTPPAGSPAPQKPASIASMVTPPAGIPAPPAARPPAESAEVDELVLEDAGGIETPAPAIAPAPAAAAPPPAYRPPPAPKPVLGTGSAPYDLGAQRAAAQRRRAGIFGEDVSQRDWRFQWIIAIAVAAVMAAVFCGAFLLSSSL